VILTQHPTLRHQRLLGQHHRLRYPTHVPQSGGAFSSSVSDPEDREARRRCQDRRQYPYHAVAAGERDQLAGQDRAEGLSEF
jgi:hypothetical protein